MKLFRRAGIVLSLLAAAGISFGAWNHFVHNSVDTASSYINSLPSVFENYFEKAEDVLHASEQAEGNVFHPNIGGVEQTAEPAPESVIDLTDIPEWSGMPYALVNDNVPFFDEQELTSMSEFMILSDKDDLGRCQANYMSVCPNSLPSEEREGIGMIKPSGWQTTRYDDLINGKYLYNRCHLLGFQLSGLNADDRNLITGTRYLNVDGQLPFENAVASYVRTTGNHVLYRVTPIYEGDNLVASGVLEEGWSVEDGGEGICFCAYCYNIQPGIEIDYADGTSIESADALNDIETALSYGATSVAGGDDPFLGG